MNYKYQNIGSTSIGFNNLYQPKDPIPETMNAVIGLEDGTILYGTGFGTECEVSGELVVTTQFMRYEEALTDPSYKGQSLMFAYPHIGNYGVNLDTLQSSGMQAEGLVVQEACDHLSHHQHKEGIHEFPEREGKSGIAGIDTRHLTIKTREHGTLRAALIVDSSSDIDDKDAVELACEQPDISEIDLISQVTCKRPHHIKGSGKNVALGCETYKLKFGYRGANQPVKDLRDGKVHIASQNHGFAVDNTSIEVNGIKVTQINTNDGTIEVFENPDLDVLSVQYHHEVHPGLRGTEMWFFDHVAMKCG